MEKRGEISAKTNWIKAIIYSCIALLASFIIIPLFSVLTKEGAEFFKSDIITISLNKSIAIGDYIYYCIVIMGTIITLYFSWALLKTSERSNELSESIKQKEEKRDLELVQSSAAFIYLDLKGLINKSAEIMYSYCEANTKLSTRTFAEEHQYRMDFVQFKRLGAVSNEWKQHISVIRKSLLEKEVNYEEIFNLYLSFETPKIYASEGHLRGCIISMPKDLFCGDFLKIFKNCDDVWQYYSELSRTSGLDEMRKTNDLNRAIECADKLKLELGKMNIESIINDKWIKILGVLDEISTSEYRK